VSSAKLTLSWTVVVSRSISPTLGVAEEATLAAAVAMAAVVEAAEDAAEEVVAATAAAAAMAAVVATIDTERVLPSPCMHRGGTCVPFSIRCALQRPHYRL